MKKSLILTDKDRYPPSPALAEGEKPKERKTAPTITLTGKQVDAFCGCSLKPGDKGTATVHYTVKAASAGDQYGDELPGEKPSDKKLTLSLTHVESDEEGDDENPDDEADDEVPEKEEAGEAAEEGEKPSNTAPRRMAQDKLSPKDALGDDDHDPA